MRHPNEDEDELAWLNAEPWQLELLEVNPDYCSWGPHEDYMISRGDGWGSAKEVESWKEFGPWELNDLNECVNFYFEVSRESDQCTTCDGNGYHILAQEVVNTFYEHQCDELGVPRHMAWHDKITEDEATALVAAGRGKPGMTAEDFNLAQHRRGIGHDAINRHILIEARLKRLGLPKRCETCDGHGYVLTAEKAHVSLVLWWLHPRKGASRGIEIKRVEREDLPAIKAFLQHAAERNATRFSKLNNIPGEEANT